MPSLATLALQRLACARCSSELLNPPPSRKVTGTCRNLLQSSLVEAPLEPLRPRVLESLAFQFNSLGLFIGVFMAPLTILTNTHSDCSWRHLQWCALPPVPPVSHAPTFAVAWRGEAWRGVAFARGRMSALRASNEHGLHNHAHCDGVRWFHTHHSLPRPPARPLTHSLGIHHSNSSLITVGVVHGPPHQYSFGLFMFMVTLTILLLVCRRLWNGGRLWRGVRTFSLSLSPAL